MKQTISLYQFRDQFMACRPDNFSYPGLVALWEYFEEYEQDTGEEIELDIIAICCEYSEFTSLKDFQASYGRRYKTLTDIATYTTVIPIPGSGFIIGGF